MALLVSVVSLNCIYATGTHSAAGPSEIRYDFFPLNIGRVWKYKYTSDERVYDSLIPIRRTLDSGSVVFQAISVLAGDTSTDWTVTESDFVLRHVIDFFYDTRDTTYSVEVVSSIVLHEGQDSSHTITCSSGFPVWQYPRVWNQYGYAVGLPVSRYAADPAIRVPSDVIQAVAPATYSDTMTFARDLGLVDVVSHIHKGPNTLYYLDWHASLYEYLVDVKETSTSLPGGPFLAQNFPNPFNPSTIIRFGVSRRTHVSLIVYNMLGQKISVLVNQEVDPGPREVIFDGTGLASGVYIYRLEAQDKMQNRTLILLK